MSDDDYTDMYLCKVWYTHFSKAKKPETSRAKQTCQYRKGDFSSAQLPALCQPQANKLTNNINEMLTPLINLLVTDFGTQQIPHLSHTCLSSNLSFKRFSNNLHTNSSPRAQPNASSCHGPSTRSVICIKKIFLTMLSFSLYLKTCLKRNINYMAKAQPSTKKMNRYWDTPFFPSFFLFFSFCLPPKFQTRRQIPFFFVVGKFI